MFKITGFVNSKFSGRIEIEEFRTCWTGVENWFNNLTQQKDACITVRDAQGRQVASKDVGFSKLVYGEHFYQD